MFIEIVLFFTLLFLLMLYTNKKPANLPPGRWGWPIIGLIPRGRKFFEEILKEFGEKYGDGGVYCSNVGSRWFVFITDAEILKKTFNRPEFSGRPEFHTLVQFGQRLGLTMSQGKIWQVNRRFTIKNLRDIGVGKTSMEAMCHFEIEYLLNHLKSIAGKPAQLNWCLHVTQLNVIWRYAADVRFNLEDHKVYYYSELNVENFEIFQMKTSLFLDYYPWTNYLPYFFIDKALNGYKMESNKEKIRRFMMQFIDEHKQTLDRENPRDFIDAYLIESEKNKDDPEMDFLQNDFNLVNILINFFNGTDFASLTLRWIITYLAMNPEIQEKLQQHIDKTVPRDRLPTMEDRDKLPYVDACVYEGARKASVVPYLIPRVTLEEVTLEGYTIPKGTTILGCAENIHNNKKYWAKPDIYYPEHFLDKDGNFVKNETTFLSFSNGKRMCMGKAFTDMTLFLFVSSIFQRFTIRPAKGVTITYKGLEHSPFSNFPKDYDFIVEPRY